MTVLRGERLVLRPLEDADAPELRRIMSTPAVARWWVRRSPSGSCVPALETWTSSGGSPCTGVADTSGTM